MEDMYYRIENEEMRRVGYNIADEFDSSDWELDDLPDGAIGLREALYAK